MSYIIQLFDKTEIEITDSEYRNLKDKTGLIHIPSINRIINMSAIMQIASREKYEEGKLIDRSAQTKGILDDGTPVIRHFGSWYLEGYLTEAGKPEKVIDPEYYPEVAMDCVPTPNEYFTKYAHLPLETRKQIVTQVRKKQSEMASMRDIMDKKLIQ